MTEVVGRAARSLRASSPRYISDFACARAGKRKVTVSETRFLVNKVQNEI